MNEYQKTVKNAVEYYYANGGASFQLTRSEVAEKFGVNYKTLSRWIKKGPAKPFGGQRALTSQSEDIIEAVVRGWAIANLPLEPGEAIDVANQVALAFENETVNLGYCWLHRFERERCLRTCILHARTGSRVEVMTVDHADQLEREYLRALALLRIESNNPSSNFRVYVMDETDTIKRWDKEEGGIVSIVVQHIVLC